jgi:hypothetical protein
MRDELHTDEDIRSVVEAAITPIMSRTIPLEEAHLQELRTIIWKDTLKELELDERRYV